MLSTGLTILSVLGTVPYLSCVVYKYYNSHTVHVHIHIIICTSNDVHAHKPYITIICSELYTVMGENTQPHDSTTLAQSNFRKNFVCSLLISALTSPALKDPLRSIFPCRSCGEGSLSRTSLSTRFSEGSRSPMIARNILAIFDCWSPEQWFSMEIITG